MLAVNLPFDTKNWWLVVPRVSPFSVDIKVRTCDPMSNVPFIVNVQ